MKRIYIGWLVVLAIVSVSLLAVKLTPQWRRASTPEQQMAARAEQLAQQGPPPEPGQGKVTGNLPRAMRLDMPILAFFNRHMHEHVGGPEQMKRQEEEMAQHEMFAELAAEYAGVMAVMELTQEAAPASVVRRNIESFPTVLIYGAERRDLPPRGEAASRPGDMIVRGADHPELWRYEGNATEEQIRAKLAELNIKPRAREPEASARG